MVVALDLEDTITAHPPFFAFLSNALIAAGHTVIVLTLRDDRAEVASELETYGVAFTDLVTADAEVLARPDPSKWKGEICKARAVEILFEDSPDTIAQLCGSVLAFVPT